MVFISYNSTDRILAEQLCIYLEQRGIKCWIAFRDITSGNFSGEITRALRASDMMVVVCSKASCRSEHVKNEVTLAFNQKKHIIPYLLEDNPYDDDLEYFLSLKQHIKTRGSQERDFALIEKFIRDYRGEQAVTPEPAPAPSPVPAPVPQAAPVPQTAAVPGKKRSAGIIAAVVAVLLLGGGAAFFLFREPQGQPEGEGSTLVQASGDSQPSQTGEKEEETATIPDTPQVQEPSREPETVKDSGSSNTNTQQPANTRNKTQSATAASSSKDTFTGTVAGGYPDGFGVYTFKTRRRIDMHDPEQRYAEAGDYIKGDWKKGHLNYGEWYSADGTKKAFIRLGDHPDTASDQKLGTCVKR